MGTPPIRESAQEVIGRLGQLEAPTTVSVGVLLGSIFFLNILEMMWINVKYTKMNREEDSQHFKGEN